MIIELTDDEIRMIKSQMVTKSETWFSIAICVVAFIASEVGKAYEIQWVSTVGFTFFLVTCVIVAIRKSSEKRWRPLVDKISGLTIRCPGDGHV